MSLALIVPIIGSVLTICLGIVGLIKPNILAIPSGLQAMNELGTMELRALFGGVFTVIGVSAIWFRLPEVFLVAGLVLIGAAVVKIISLTQHRLLAKLAAPGIAFDLFVGMAVASGYFLA